MNAQASLTLSRSRPKKGPSQTFSCEFCESYQNGYITRLSCQANEPSKLQKILDLRGQTFFVNLISDNLYGGTTEGISCHNYIQAQDDGSDFI